VQRIELDVVAADDRRELAREPALAEPLVPTTT
jgi:hypothetical protein